MVSPEISLFDSDQLKNLTINEIGTVWQKIDMAATASIFNSNFDDKSKRLLAHNFTDILSACQFNYEKCDASDFEWSFDPYYGNCYSFNTGFNSSGHRVKLKESSVSGWLFGLQLELYVNHNENLSLFNDAKGLLVRINNSSYLVDQSLDGIRISPGLRTNLAISREFNFIMPQPYSNCLVDSQFRNYDSDLFRLILNSPYQYSQKFCLEQCFQREVLSQCNCTASVFVSLYKDAHQCGNTYEILCGFNTFSKIYLANNFIKDQCLPSCPLECNNSNFKISSSSNVINGNKYVNHIMHNPNLLQDFTSKSVDANTAKESVSYLNIYYESLSYKLSYESPKMTMFTLLASIGGNLSLFLGISVFSLCELIQLFIECYFMKRVKVEVKKIVVKSKN
jgi:hypothetical protein